MKTTKTTKTPDFNAQLTAALAPLFKRIDELEAKLAPVIQRFTPPELSPAVKEVKVALDGIPKETLGKLAPIGVLFDGKKPWFQIARQNGTFISVKKTEAGFRVRVRDEAGALVKEENPTCNGLNGLLAKLA